MKTILLSHILLLGLSMASSAVVVPQGKRQGEDKMMVETRYQGPRHLQEFRPEGGFDIDVCSKIIPFDSIRHKALYKVGVLVIHSPESAFEEFNKSTLLCLFVSSIF